MTGIRGEPPSWVAIGLTGLVAAAAVVTLALPIVDRVGPDDGGTPAAAGTDEPSGRAPDEGPLRLKRVAGLAGPVALADRPGDDDLYLATLEGTVRRLAPAGGGGSVGLVDEPVLDLRAVVRSGEGEQGLVDVTFSPDGDRMLVSYTADDGALIVDAYPVAAGTSGPGDGVRIIRVPQIRDNHNGGNLAFGPDGALFLGLGDGGSNDGPSVAQSLRASQDTSNLLGALVRVEPDMVAGGYAIPADNPLVDRPGRDEIWLHGLRNPFRLSFDAHGGLWVPDVGGAEREEINYLPPPGAGRAANLGWGRMEGSMPVLDATPPPGHVPPLHEYPHENGRCAVVGGVRVAGDRYPELTGRYLFSDFCGGGLLSLVERPDGSWVEEEVELAGDDAEAAESVVAVEQMADGTIYVVDLSGEVSRLDGR